MENVWYVHIHGVSKGPISAEEVKKLLEQGELNNDNLIWKHGWNEWKRLSMEPLFADIKPVSQPSYEPSVMPLFEEVPSSSELSLSLPIEQEHEINESGKETNTDAQTSEASLNSKPDTLLSKPSALAESCESGHLECPICRTHLNKGAQRCHFCGHIVKGGVKCPMCSETVWADAQICRYCGTNLKKLIQKSLRKENLQQRLLVKANRIGIALIGATITGLLFPPEIEINDEEILIRSWSLFGLRTNEQKISGDRIASVRYFDGIFWSSVTIETMGGAISDLTIHALTKSDGKLVAEAVEQLKG